MTNWLESRLIKRKRMGNVRSLQVSENLIDFASNDYLGLARSQHLVDLISQEKYKLGSTGSRLLTGNSLYAQNLEERIARFHGYEAGLLFGCGYLANVGLLSAVATHGDTIFFDAHIHASIHDSIRLSRARAYPFRHNDLNHLERRLKNSCTQGRRFICIESIYSTDGSQTPLKEICFLAERYDAHLIVDEAHAVGVCGPEGRGLVAKHQLISHVFAQISTFGKALGVYGAVVLGSNALKQVLINFARSFIYTTALPFYSLAAIKCSYDLFPMLENERSYLARISHKKHIQIIKIEGNYVVKQRVKQLAQDGFDVRPLMSPTIQRGDECLRICLHTFNTEEEVSALLESIKSW